ncbi:alpha/beta hydrolase [Myroides odoratus]|uniref:alpha/beta hydrolase n=1 Tax=Myroides odoratus TaxID=256 RepID=UPI00333FDDC8
MRIVQFIFLLITSCVSAQNARYYYEYESVIPNQARFDKLNVKAYNEAEKIQLYGTLLMPKTPFDKVVMIIPGSGPDSRENHFKLAEELLLQNIAVFRYDERGVSESDGEFNEVVVGINQWVDDMGILYQQLKQVPAVKDKQIGLIGHSLGGMIAIDALNKKKVNPSFMVQWSTPIQSHGEWLKYQLKNGIGGLPQELKYHNLEDAYKIMDIYNKKFASTNDATTREEDYVLGKAAQKEAKKAGYTSRRFSRFRYASFPTFRELIKKDFEKMYAITDVPTFYIIGTNDLIVEAAVEVEKLKSLENKNITIKVMDGLDHYLTTETELILSKEMYHIDVKASDAIIQWIKAI